MFIAVVVCFLNEERYLGVLLESILAQDRPPDRLVLVDDGSTDASADIASDFAQAHAAARLLRRPPRPLARDRMVSAPELSAFLWALDQIDDPYDVVAKMDADLRLTPDVIAEMERRFTANPRLGIAGTFLSTPVNGGELRRERNPSYHVRGPAKFYRRRCLEEILPLPLMLGWDTIDEVKARLNGWTTASFELPNGDPLHLRPTGSHDGILRGFRRDGDGAYRYGAHPLHVLLGAANRLRDRPRVLGGLHYLAGWGLAAARRAPRADPEVRARARREQLARIRAMLSGRAIS
jgi:biofilm PGA synthesis N-glycosyltransferase PgaC